MFLTRRHGSPILTRNPSSEQIHQWYNQPAASAVPVPLPTCRSGALDTPKAAHRCPPSAVHRHSGGSKHYPMPTIMAQGIICTAVSLTPPSMPQLLQASMPGIKLGRGTNFPIQTFGRWGWWLQSERDLGDLSLDRGSLPQDRLLVGGQVRLGSTVGWSIGMTEWPSLSTP